MVVPLALVLLSVSGCAQRVREGEGIRLLTREVSLGKIHPGIIVESLTVSPDGKHFAYVARRGGKWFVVVDGKEGKEYDEIGEGTPIFSPDSKHFAYVARRGGRWFVVVDGKEGKEYDGIGKGTLVFSPDSKHLAYEAMRGGKSFVVVDGKEGKEYFGNGE
jgi:Tol biopolymer transport system component